MNMLIKAPEFYNAIGEEKERILVMFDGSNAFAAFRNLNINPDYAKIYALFQNNFNLRGINYYTATIADESGHIKIQPMLDYLAYNGYTMIIKEGKEYNQNGETRRKGNIDVELVVDAMVAAPNVDTLILFSGDGDYVPLIRYYQKMAKRVIVVSTIQGHSPVCADELRRAANVFIDVNDVFYMEGVSPPLGESK